MNSGSTYFAAQNNNLHFAAVFAPIYLTDRALPYPFNITGLRPVI